MTDSSFHLVTESGQVPLKDYHESFVRLSALGVMAADLAKEIAMAAGLRNRIVQEYDEIDPGRVYEALPVAVRRIPIYLDHVQRFIKKLPLLIRSVYRFRIDQIAWTIVRQAGHMESRLHHSFFKHAVGWNSV